MDNVLCYCQKRKNAVQCKIDEKPTGEILSFLKSGFYLIKLFRILWNWTSMVLLMRPGCENGSVDPILKSLVTIKPFYLCKEFWQGTHKKISVE